MTANVTALKFHGLRADMTLRKRRCLASGGLRCLDEDAEVTSLTLGLAWVWHMLTR